MATAQRANPDLIIARFDEQRAKLAIRVAKDPFRPKVIAGSGLAYTYGFPMSVDGSAPSILQVRGIGSIFNRPASYHVAQTTEQARTASLDVQVKRDEVLLRTSTLFLDALKWQRTADSLRSQLDSLRRSAETVQARVREGRDLEIENKRAQLAIARTQHRLELAEQESDFAQGSLAIVLGYPATDRLQPVASAPFQFPLPASEEAAVNQALDQSKEIRRLESAILAKRFEIRKHKAEVLPRVEMISQYALLAKYNGYDDFFPKFQRHNTQLGVSVQIPLYASAASMAQTAQAEVEINGYRTQVTQVRNRISVDTQNAFRQVRLGEKARELARLDLEVAREQVNILLAQLEEGRATLRQLEEARFLEQEKWIAYHDSQFTADRLKFELLRATGDLAAAVQ
ncbi:MAG: TolC family protein [Acidobacteria bacterium]|nr:TolC family protein [Acidobacteriota bacterium]